jgi:hypothetical protein
VFVSKMSKHGVKLYKRKTLPSMIGHHVLRQL